MLDKKTGIYFPDYILNLDSNGVESAIVSALLLKIITSDTTAIKNFNDDNETYFLETKNKNINIIIHGDSDIDSGNDVVNSRISIEFTYKKKKLTYNDTLLFLSNFNNFIL